MWLFFDEPLIVFGHRNIHWRENCPAVGSVWSQTRSRCRVAFVRREKSRRIAVCFVLSQSLCFFLSWSTFYNHPSVNGFQAIQAAGTQLRTMSDIELEAHFKLSLWSYFIFQCVVFCFVSCCFTLALFNKCYCFWTHETCWFRAPRLNFCALWFCFSEEQTLVFLSLTPMRSSFSVMLSLSLPLREFSIPHISPVDLSLVSVWLVCSLNFPHSFLNSLQFFFLNLFETHFSPTHWLHFYSW